MTVTVSRVLEGAFSAAAGVSGLTGFIMLFSALMHSGLIGIYTKFAFSGRGIGGIPGGAPEPLVHVAPTFRWACVRVYSVGLKADATNRRTTLAKKTDRLHLK